MDTMKLGHGRDPVLKMSNYGLSQSTPVGQQIEQGTGGGGWRSSEAWVPKEEFLEDGMALALEPSLGTVCWLQEAGVLGARV
jgi:hypothetical protein